MSENNNDPQKARPNVKRLFMTNVLADSLHKLCAKLEIDEKRAMLLALAKGFHALDCMTDSRFIQLEKRWSYSKIQEEDRKFLEDQKKLVEQQRIEKIKMVEDEADYAKWLAKAYRIYIIQLEKLPWETREQYTREYLEQKPEPEPEIKPVPITTDEITKDPVEEYRRLNPDSPFKLDSEDGE